MADSTEIVAEALRSAAGELGESLPNIETPRGYAHLTLALLDSVWSLRSHYNTVKGVLNDYTAGVSELADRDRWWLAAANAPGFVEHDVDAFLARCQSREIDALTDELFGGRRSRTPGPTGILKAHACLQAAKNLKAAGVTTRDELNDAVGATKDGDVERAWRSVPGLGQASWRYLLNLSGVEAVKPDTMVTRFVNGALSDAGMERVSAAEAGRLLESAATLLQREHPTLSVRALDHLAWRAQRAR